MYFILFVANIMCSVSLTSFQLVYHFVWGRANDFFKSIVYANTLLQSLSM